MSIELARTKILMPSSLVKGYSRDHRPELNQVVLELMGDKNQDGLPVYMQALSGNTNDATQSFSEVSGIFIA
jgi:transposase